jgi:predicted SAM-dependent methyltransferase
MDYVFRTKTRAMFEDSIPTYIFDFFVLEDMKFDEFFLFENIWRETLLLNKFYKDHL